MPKYSNSINMWGGNDHLKIPPNATDVPSIFFYNIENLTITDTEPYYNPILFREDFIFTGGETFMVDLPENAIGQNAFIYIQTISNIESMASIDVTFNSLSNLPALPLGNTTFNINNNNRIKRIYFKVVPDCSGEIIIIVTDKFIISDASMHYDYKP